MVQAAQTVPAVPASRPVRYAGDGQFEEIDSLIRETYDADSAMHTWAVRSRAYRDAFRSYSSSENLLENSAHSTPGRRATGVQNIS